jgi:cytochrome c biogenesis protein CcmG/thiol:disulfide interchange protein DsbE
MRLSRMVLTAAAGVLSPAASTGLAGADPAMDAPAPALVATALKGQTFDLAKLRGKVVLVNFWATWCVPCRKEMPVLDAFYQHHREQGLELIGISVDFARDSAKMRKASGAVGYPTAMASDIAVNGFGAPKGVPITYVIDTQGVVRDRFIAVDDELLNGVVIPLLPRQKQEE